MVHPSNPELFETQLSLAAAQAREGRLAEAATCYRNAISINPNHSNAHNELGCLLERQGELDEAYASFRKAIALDPNHVNAHNNLAMLLGRQGKLDEARISLQVALALDPGHSDAHCNLGNVLLKQGKLDDASTSYRRAIALNPNHINAHNNLGVLLQRQGRLDEAFISFQTVIALNPNHPNAHNSLGFVLERQGKPDEASTSFRRAIALNPNDSGAHSNLAATLLTQGRVEDAIASCRRALAIQPENAKAHEALGFAFQHKGEPTEAASFYRRAIELGSTNPMASHLLAAVSGADAGPTPREVVINLFNDYASRFDAHLVETLRYSAPRLMREVVGRLIRNDRRFKHALDLGCGTGLIGTHFNDVVAEIDGVDLSPKILEQARRKQVYRKLDCEEIIAWLERAAGESLSFDIVLSADVFIYIGNLEPVFKAIRRILTADGLFVFSVELMAQGTFALLPTCRYAHSTSYVRELASRHGFTVAVSEQIDLREDRKVMIDGTIFVLTSS